MSVSNDDDNQPKLHEVTPREVSGRDSTARDQAQFRAAAHECLSLLEDSSIDRVYSDFQDDFVSRMNSGGTTTYNFYQVKTKSKRNHQWSANEMFGIGKRKGAAPDPNKIADSFVGKMIVHTLNFKNSCAKVTFLTNVHLDDDVEHCFAAIISGTKGNKHYDVLVESFNTSFSPPVHLGEAQVIELLKKITLEPNISYLSPEDEAFATIAREAIYKYSEIDLQHQECEEIVKNLISLVTRKTFPKLIGEIAENELDEKAGIGISEMLDILSISKGAFKQLKAGGDSRAVKSASIIQRVLKRNGASEPVIEYVTSSKVKWDVWLREKRHVIPEFEINLMLERIELKTQDWQKDEKGIFTALKGVTEGLLQEFKYIGSANDLDKDHILGAIFSSIVRNESQ